MEKPTQPQGAENPKRQLMLLSAPNATSLPEDFTILPYLNI